MFQIPKNYVGAVLGKGKIKQREFITKSGVKSLSVVDRDKDTTTLRVIGSPESCKLAELQIQKFIVSLFFTCGFILVIFLVFSTLEARIGICGRTDVLLTFFVQNYVERNFAVLRYCQVFAACEMKFSRLTYFREIH